MMMRNNKLYKILRITFLILAIISMTFTIFYKVGHCEEPSSLGASGGGSGSNDYYPWSVPLPIAHDVGFNYDVSDSIKEYVVNDIEDGIIGSDNGYNYTGLVVGALLSSEYDATNNRITFTYLRGTVAVQDWSFDPSPSSPLFLCRLYYNQGYGFYIYDISSGSCVSFRNRSSSPGSFALTQGYEMPYNELLPTGASRLVVPKLTFIGNYPVWVRGGSLSYDGNVVFSSSVGSSGGHSKGGAIADIDDSIEDSSELPQVDDELPADPTTPNLIKKILSALKTINKTIGGVGISIVDSLLKILEKLDILDDIKQFYQDYNNIKNTSSADVVTAWQGTIIYSTYSNIRGDISSFLNMFNVTPASSAPTWTIPLNGTVLYNQNYPNIVIDFGFYDRFRNTVSNILVAILTCSCVFNIIRSIPDIITGASGDESS